MKWEVKDGQDTVDQIKKQFGTKQHPKGGTRRVKRSTLGSSEFRQSDYIASRLVVEPVETHQRVPRREHAGQAASRWAAENTQGI